MEDLTKALARSRAGAPELWAELTPYRFQDQCHLIRVHRRFVTWGLCELLCQESARLTAIAPSSAVETAELAVLVSDLLKEEAPADTRRHNLLWNLTSIEEYETANLLFPQVSALCRELGNPLDLVRLRWAEGRIATGLGRTEAAIQLFQELRQEFAVRGIAYDAALVTLE